MNEMKAMVKEWHEAFGVPVNLELIEPTMDRRELRANLIAEECNETCAALVWVCESEKCAFVEIADGLADSLYVIFGACLEFGIPIEEVFAEVHRSNMSKMWTAEEIKADLPDGAKWGLSKITHFYRRYIVERADGKILKSPSYEPANIAAILDRAKSGGKAF